MTVQVDHIPRTGDTTPTEPRDLPSMSDDLAWTTQVVVDIADVTACASREELVDTYGTDDPAELGARFALPDDVAAAERFAAEGRQVAA